MGLTICINRNNYADNTQISNRNRLLSASHYSQNIIRSKKKEEMNNNDFIGYLKNNLNNAGDGLIRQIRIDLTEYKIILELSVESTEGWLNLEIIAENISEFTIKQKRNEDLQVIFNMDIQIIDGLYWFNLDCADANNDINQIRTSNLYFVCETFNVRFLPYREKINE